MEKRRVRESRATELRVKQGVIGPRNQNGKERGEIDVYPSDDKCILNPN